MPKPSDKNSTGTLILIAVIIASGMAFLDGSVVTIAIPTIQQKLAANIADIQWVVTDMQLNYTQAP